MWYIYRIEFCTAVKKNETMTFAGKWIQVENIIIIITVTNFETGSLCIALEVLILIGD